MRTTFSFPKGRWSAAGPESVSQYDIVCLSPPLDPIQGLPLGNGDLGGWVWCEPQKLVLAVNKCDLWDDSPDDERGGFTDDYPRWEDRWTALRHACRLEIDLGLPFMDTWYLTDFEARLDLAQARVLIKATTPFGVFQAKIFVSRAARVLAVNWTMDAKEAFAPSVLVERWGSRTFAHWYSQIQKDPSIGLADTATAADGDDLVITQKLRRLDFAVATRVMANGRAVPPTRNHGRSGRFVLPLAARHAAQLFLAVENSEEVAEPQTETRKQVAVAVQSGLALIETEHTDSWRRFWERTHLRIGDRFLENLWHLTLYFAGSSQQGRYPALFTQGLWGWNRDFQPWNFYYHWNQQQLAWPLCAAGHPDLMNPYLNYRFRMLEEAKRMAARLGKAGAWYRDIADRNGKQLSCDLNRTPGGQIAADFWRYYRFTGNLDLLREKGWPVIYEVARWHYAILKKGSDGQYHATPANGYEGQTILKDGTAELVTARQVFEVAIAAAAVLQLDPPELAQWRDALVHLTPILTMPSPGNSTIEIFAAGLQKGTEKNNGKSMLWDEGDEEEWRKARPVCAHDPGKWGAMFSDLETSPVFPAGQIGLRDAGARALALAQATAREAVKGWTHGIVLARLGLKAELKKHLGEYPSQQQLTITGLGGDNGADFGKVAQVKDGALAPDDFAHKDFHTHPDWAAFRNSATPFRMWEFRRTGQESIFLIATAINEALLQSHDGVIRVAPAAFMERYAFTLWAEGGFRVSAEGDAEGPAWVQVQSERGGRCRVVNPWPGRAAFLWDHRRNDWREIRGEEIAFDTEPGADYALTPEHLDLEALETVAEHPEANRGPVVSADGKVTLGIPRMF